MENDCLSRTSKELTDVYQRNVNTIYRLCYLYLQNHADAEDAVQSTFMKWLKATRTFTDYEHEKAGEVLEQLLLLPPKYKEILYLYYYEEYSIKEISKLLERSESTIQTQLYNGRNRLKMSLGGMYRDLPH